MSVAHLEKSTLEKIDKKLPDLRKLQKIVVQIAPDIISMKFNHKSTIPIAAVCLKDTIKILSEARYALREIHINKIYHLEKVKEPNELASVYFSKFYADDIALRLYAAAEHLACSIMYMLEIKMNEIKNEKRKNTKISNSSVLGKYLLKTMPTHTISKAISKLINSEDWTKTLEYRNKWVHEQPPLVEGLGIVYNPSSGKKLQR